jgi:flagellar biosynthesis protein FliR
MSDELIPKNEAELSLAEVKTKIEMLEEQLLLQSIEIETLNSRIPDSNIISPNFLKRAFTVWGHYVVAGFIIAIPFMCLSMLFVLVLAFFGEYSY